MQNADVSDLDPEQFQKLSDLHFAGCAWCTTLDRRVGAGFYASGEGPVPYIFARVPPQEFKIYERVAGAAKPRFDEPLKPAPEP